MGNSLPGTPPVSPYPAFKSRGNPRGAADSGAPRELRARRGSSSSPSGSAVPCVPESRGSGQGATFPIPLLEQFLRIKARIPNPGCFPAKPFPGGAWGTFPARFFPALPDFCSPPDAGGCLIPRGKIFPAAGNDVRTGMGPPPLPAQPEEIPAPRAPWKSLDPGFREASMLCADSPNPDPAAGVAIP